MTNANSVRKTNASLGISVIARSNMPKRKPRVKGSIIPLLTLPPQWNKRYKDISQGKCLESTFFKSNTSADALGFKRVVLQVCYVIHGFDILCKGDFINHVGFNLGDK